MYKKNILLVILFVFISFLVFPNNVLADEEEETKMPCPLCIYKDKDNPLYKKERQFYYKVRLLKQQYGESVDEIALAASVLQRYGTTKAYNTLYEKDFDESKYKSLASGLLKLFDSGNNSDSNLTDSEKELVSANEKIDLLTLSALVMVDSNHHGSYSDVCFKEGLSGNSLVGNKSQWDTTGAFSNFADRIINTFVCFTSKLDTPEYSDASNVAIASERQRLKNLDRVCKNGYIGGIYTDVFDMEESNKKTLIKRKYAQDIIDLAQYYRKNYMKMSNTCASNTALSTGEYAEWKQYGSEWSSLDMGGVPSISRYGCLVTSISIQIARSGTQLGTLPNGYTEFNPGAFVTSLNQNGGFAGGANFNWSGYEKIAPHWHDAGFVSLNISNSQELAKVVSDELKTGAGDGNKYQKFLVLNIHHASSSQHWIAVNGVEDGVVKTFDPGDPGTSLDESYVGWVVEGYEVFYADDVMFGQTGTSSSSSSGNSCGTGGSLDGLASFLGYVEGATPCNYRGQGEETGYLASALNDGMGYTAAFGLTYYMEPYAKQVGYNDFIADKDGPDHCNSKQYIDKMLPLVMDSFMKQVDTYAEAKHVNLTEVQRHALTSIAHGGGAFEEYVIDALANHSAESDEVLEAFKKTYNPSDSSYRYGLGLRRMAEYEMFVTGNYNAAKPFDLFDSDAEIQAASKSLVQKNWPTTRDVFVWNGSVSKTSPTKINVNYGTDGLKCVDGKAVSADDTSSSGSVPVTCAKSSGTTNVLFAGNSRTFVHDIDVKFKGFVESAGYSVNVTAPSSSLDGGKTLEEFLNTRYDDVNKNYDCVVLQEQSDVYVNDYSTFNSGVKDITGVVRNNNKDVKTYVRQTWTTSSFNNLEKAYSNANRVAEANGAYVIKDGKSFENSHSTYPSINLFDDDIHQSNEGAYLSAACIYKTLYGKSPIGSNYTGGLSKDNAEKLQKIADSVCDAPKTNSTGMGQAVVDLALQHLSEGGAEFWNYIFGGGFINGSATPWCAAFVTWVLDHASYNNTSVRSIIDVRAAGKSGAGAGGYLEYASANGMLKYNDSCSMYAGKNGSSYTPKAGDLVIFSWGSDWDGVPSSDSPGHDHIGIVEKSEGGMLYTVEGNSSDSVRQKEYSLNNCQVSAFVSWEK